jgi:hypothetical protein
VEDKLGESDVGIINYCEFDTESRAYDFADSHIKTYDLFCLLNTLFGKVDLYYETEEYISTCDSYYRYEEIYDSEKLILLVGECDYCYGDGTAFGKTVDIENEDDLFALLSDIGTQTEKIKLKLSPVLENVRDTLLEQVKEKGYSEIVELVSGKIKSVSKEVVYPKITKWESLWNI